MISTDSRYDLDTYFIETCDALAAMNIDQRAFAHDHAVMLLKPDAAVTGSMGGSAITWLRDHGYRIVGGAYAVQLTYLHLRALWYFNWHRATAERRRVADRLARLSPSLVLVVGHPDSDQPVSVRLTADKGPADPTERLPPPPAACAGGGNIPAEQGSHSRRPRRCPAGVEHLLPGSTTERRDFRLRRRRRRNS